MTEPKFELDLAVSASITLKENPKPKPNILVAKLIVILVCRHVHMDGVCSSLVK